MATFTGTNASETITPTFVSPTVTRNPAGSLPGNGTDVINAGAGADHVDGGGGNDIVDLGGGDDVFEWHVDGGSDFADGQTGTDRFKVVGTAGAEFLFVGADPTTLLGGNLDGPNDDVVSFSEMEILDITLLGGGDFLEIGNLAGSGIRQVDVDLGGTGAPGDGAEDTVEIDGTDGKDTITITKTGNLHRISGAGPEITVGNAEAGKDGLILKGFGGADALDASGSGVFVTLIGNDGNDTLLGSAHGDVLEGDAGSDTLIGGAGGDALVGSEDDDPASDNDTASYATSKARVAIDLAAGTASGGDAQGDILVEIESLIGSTFDDTLIGDGGKNTLSGLAGDDRLFGSAGADRLEGGAGDDLHAGGIGADVMLGGTGNDTYFVENAGDVVTEGAAAGIDTVAAAANHTLAANVENLRLDGDSPAAIKGTGNGLNNSITGSDAANVLDGKAGKDTLIGGRGNDTYVVDNAGDKVTEKAGEGNDTVLSSVAFVLGAEVENLTLTGSGSPSAKASAAGVNGTGNALANSIAGSGGANIINGGAGDDTLGAEGGRDKVLGGLGDDELSGGRGKDKLTGGDGSDSFLFDAKLGKANADKIKDFRPKDDTILLDLFDGLGLGALKKKAYFEGGAAHDGSDRIILTDKGQLLFDADGKGGDKAVIFAKLGKDTDLSHNDFIVI